MRLWKLALVGALVGQTAAAQDADVIFTNGNIYTVNAAMPWAEAVAIKDGKVLSVGTTDDVMTEADAGTEIVDLDGRFAMPRVVDAHIHVPNVHSGEESGELKFGPDLTPDEIKVVLTEYLAANPDLEWIRGEQRGTSQFPGGRMEKGFIDEVSADRPIFLIDDTGHNGTVNSIALEMAGISAATEAPPGGAIHIGEDGEPSGYLSEGAMGLVGEFLPRPDVEAYYRAISRALPTLTELGITSWKEATANEEILLAYRSLEEEGRFPFRIAAAILSDDCQKYILGYEKAQDLIERRADLSSPLIAVNAVKWFADGTPLSRTSRLLAAYPDTDGDFGIDSLFEREKRDIVAVHVAGLQGMFHAIGDGTIRTLLDLIEEGRRQSPQPDLIHHIAHANLSNADDIQRLKELNVAAEFSPRTLMYPGMLANLARQAVGDAIFKRWSPIRELLDAGALVAYGSDWPQGTPDPNPWAGMEVFVTRQDPTCETPGQQTGGISIAEAIEVFTLNGAKLLLLTTKSGRSKRENARISSSLTATYLKSTPRTCPRLKL